MTRCLILGYTERRNKDEKNMKLFIYALMTGLTVNIALAMEKLDQLGVPNESGTAIAEKLKDKGTSVETIYSYFSHYSPVIRKQASEAMATRGEEAMPYIIKGLKSFKKYEARASCDAISGVRQFFGMSVKAVTIKTELVVKAMPDIIKLLDHDHSYVRLGALQALSKCGKAAASSLSRVVPLLKDEEWWVRDAAGCVMEGVGSPETDKYLEKMAIALRDEMHVECYNFMSGRLAGLAMSASKDVKDKLAIQLVKNIPEMNYPWKKQRALSVLDTMNTNGVAALPAFDKLLEKQETLVADLKKKSKSLADEDWLLGGMKKTRHLLAGTKPEKK